MIGKTVAAALSLGLISAAPTLPPQTTISDLTAPSPFRGSFEVVPKVECGMSRGSGVRISDDIVITAAHVATNGLCGIDGIPMALAYRPLGLDFVALRGALGPGYRAIVSCEGILPGERYQAFGYALGGKPNVEPLLGTNQRGPDKTAMLRGKVYRGMSGGAVFNEGTGAVVAITVMLHKEADWAYVVPLSETYLCEGRDA